MVRSDRNRLIRYDSGDAHPSDLDDVKPYPSFIGRDTHPGTDPDREYGYGQYYPVVADLPDKPGQGSGGGASVFPAEVMGGSGETYTCNVYENGLQNDPVSVPVRQLQIAGAETIPAGTWALVAKQSYPDPSAPIPDPDDPPAEAPPDLTQYTMQVAVWL